MKKKVIKKQYFLVILLTLLLSACSQGEFEIEENVAIQKNELNNININESIKIVEEYLTLNEAENAEELLFNTRKKIEISTNEINRYYSFLAKDLEQWVEVYNFLKDCSTKYDKRLCEHYYEFYTFLFTESKVTINSVEIINYSKLSATVFVNYDIEMNGDNENNNELYFLKNENNVWKISNIIYNYDEYNQEEFFLNESEFSNGKNIFNDFKREFDAYLQDECSLIAFDNSLTHSEINEEQDICYMGKYVDTALLNNDPGICDSIFDAYNIIALCYAGVAINENDISICSNMKANEYEAKGYLDPISDRDLCHLYYIKEKAYSDVSIDFEYDKICDEIKNNELRQDCLLTFQ